jgi:hypothetical protein
MHSILKNLLYVLFGLNFINNSFSSYTNPINSLVSNKIIVIADIHADINRFKEILKDAKVLDYNDNWIALKNTTIIQLGDQIDPKTIDNKDIDDTHHFSMIYYTNNLQKLAEDNGSKFISLIGNHELMNLQKIKRKTKLRNIIAKRPIIYFLQNYAFCHAGFKQKHFYILNTFNKTVDDLGRIWYNYVYDMSLSTEEEIILNNLILDTTDSILYTRIPDNKDDINKLFKLLNLDYLFVGHSETNFIHSKNKIWYLDLQLKLAFDANTYNYIIIDNDDITVKALEYYSLFRYLL